MTNNQYIFRLDDITPCMNRENLHKLEKIFDQYHTKPIIGVIPDNQDSTLNPGPALPHFWERIKALQAKGRTIAQHGYQHTYITKKSGIFHINSYSEFAGLPYDEQLNKIKKGKDILEDKLGISVKRRMAPAHSLDRDTCKALKKLGFEYITDGIALYPYKKYGLQRLPQQLWKPTKLPIGTITICLHPNTMNSKNINQIADFCKKYTKYLGNTKQVSYKMNFARRFINFAFKIMFFIILKIKKIG